MSKLLFPFTGHLKDRIISPDELKSLILTDSNLKYNDGSGNRLTISSTKSALYAGDSGNYIDIRNNSLRINQGGQRRMWMDNLSTELKSPDQNNYLELANSLTQVVHNNVTRFFISDTQVVIQAADFSNNFIVDSTGVFYSGSEILTTASSIEALVDVGEMTPTEGQVLTFNAVSGLWEAQTGSGAGDVVGPVAGTDNAIARFDTITGKLIQDSVVIIDDVGVVSGITQLDVDNLRIDGNTLSSLNTNGTVILNPAGTGFTDIQSYLRVWNSNQEMVIQAKTSASGSVGLRIKQYAADKATIMDFMTDLSVRKGWFGYGTSADRHRMSIFNDYSDGGIGIHPGNSSGAGVVTLDGFTKLGEGAFAIKVKRLSGSLSATEGADTDFTHGLTKAKIVGVSVIVHGSTVTVGPHYTAIAEHQYTWEINATVVRINMHNTNAGLIKSKDCDILLTYIA